MADMAPELLERIQRDFARRVEEDQRINEIKNALKDGKVRAWHPHEYAQSLGKDLSQALKSQIKTTELPDGKLYWNIGEKTVKPMMEQNASMINDAITQMQEQRDRKDGIRIKPVAADIPEDRISGLVNKLALAEGQEWIEKWLGEPIINFSEHIADAFARKNAGIRRRAGYQCHVQRILAPKCCEWCADVAGRGRYRYGEEPRDFWRRHEFCRCVVIFESAMEAEAAWTKDAWDADAETLADRRSADAEVFELTPEEAAEQQEKLLERDKAIRQIMRREKISRSRAAKAYDKLRKEGIA